MASKIFSIIAGVFLMIGNAIMPVQSPVQNPSDNITIQKENITPESSSMPKTIDVQKTDDSTIQSKVIDIAEINKLEEKPKVITVITIPKTIEVQKINEVNGTTIQPNVINTIEINKLEEKPNVITTTLPSGAIVEIDSDGNVVRFIQQPILNLKNLEMQILNIKVTPSIASVKIEWKTNIPTNSKIFITGGNFSSQAYNSLSGLSTSHAVTVSGLSVKENILYSYEIEASDRLSTSHTKRIGTFKMLSRPYLEILNEVKVRIGLNPNLPDTDLILSIEENIVYEDYKNSIPIPTKLYIPETCYPVVYPGMSCP